MAKSGFDPNPRGYFVLTRFRTWKPGARIELLAPGAPPAALLVGAGIFAFVGAVVGYFFGGASLHPFSHWQITVAAALLAATIGLVFISGALPRRYIDCDWRTQMLTITTGGDQLEYRLADVTALVIANLRFDEMVDEDRRSTYAAQLTATIANTPVQLLATDHWEDNAPKPLHELRPIARHWAEALNVPLEEGPEEKFRHHWPGIWRHALPPFKWLLLLECAALVALALWRLTS